MDLRFDYVLTNICFKLLGLDLDLDLNRESRRGAPTCMTHKSRIGKRSLIRGVFT